MKNLVQIICGAGGLETIEECARVPESLGATVIVVYALWPQYDYPNGNPDFAKTSDLVNPNFDIDDIESIAKQRGWHYIRMDKFAFNGEQYNTALKYIKEKNIPCEHIWFVDSDECLDPDDVGALSAHIDQCKSASLEQIRFNVKIEILPEWKFVVAQPVSHGNYGILWGKALNIERETYFDGNYQFKEEVKFGVTNIPLFHLHNIRKNCAQRIVGDIYSSGGIEHSIKAADFLPDILYVQYLKNKYGNSFYKNFSSVDSYLGPSIFKS